MFFIARAGRGEPGVLALILLDEGRQFLPLPLPLPLREALHPPSIHLWGQARRV